ncbi:MAG: penicillin-binding protein 2 [Spirochaetales bacterium]|nr:penicillin-binding protein 2 [Spirochaetales bacterium]
MNNDPTIKTKIYIFITLIIAVFLFYILYLYDLQIRKSPEYQSRARNVSLRVNTIPAQRGEIFDRNRDNPLVINIDSFAVNIIPAEIEDKSINSVIFKLSEILKLDPVGIRDKIPKNFHNQYHPIEIKSGVSLSTINLIAENIEDFKGVSWNSKPIRSYLEYGSISHVLGYVGDITTEEFQVLYNKGYDINSVVGKSGIEKYYDQILRGEDGVHYKTVDVQGRRIKNVLVDDLLPENGKDLVLTIDRHIQILTEEALGERMGSAIVLKPSTGEILALVSYPWFNPNNFYGDLRVSAFREAALDPRHPFLNRTIQSNYEPASTFKVIMTTADLEEELFRVNKTINCEGSVWFGDREFNCHVPEGHGALVLHEALEQSCNVYFYTLGLKYLGIDRISDYARRFGFGSSTGIDLPGEISGLVPTPEWKERVYNTKWMGGDTVNTSIGQGFLNTTPIQVANMMAMIVNKGVIYKPHLLKEVRDSISGALIEVKKPEIIHTSTIHQETFTTMQNYLRGVITDGTAKVVITTNAVEIAGKTGTGEVGLDDSWNAWFVAYGPYDAEPEDQIVVLTMVEAVNDWEWWAIRAANIIFQGIFAGENYDEAIDSLRWGWLRNKRKPQ